MKHSLSASIVIVTRNRCADLLKAVESAVMQRPACEVLVIDDGSSDGSSERISGLFPGVLVLRHSESRGCVVRRNEAARIVTGDVIFSIDDDAVFSSAYVVEQTLQAFELAEVGAVAIPLIEPNRDSRRLQFPPDAKQIWLTGSYIGTAHAVRRAVFLEVGGYRNELVHQGEERDFCIRMLDRGWVTRLGTSDPILHYESPRRDFRRMDFYGRRNDVLFAGLNVPLLYVAPHLIATTANGILFGLRERRPVAAFRGLISGYLDLWRLRRLRAPVSGPTYRQSRALTRGRPLMVPRGAAAT